MKEYKSFYKTVAGNEGMLCHYPTRLDTYGCGCAHDCSYCYAKSLLDFRGLWHPDNPSVADIEKIKRKLKKIEPGTILRMGGMTDCFQPDEAKYHVTLETIKEMNRLGIGYLIVTKSAMVASKDFMDIYDKNLAHIQVTVTSTDDNTALKYESASPVSQRIKAIEKLQRNGFDVSIRLSPFVPEFINIDKINEIQCDKILIEFLRCNSFIRKSFPIDYRDYTEKHGGYWHLPLDKKIELLKTITIPQRTVCDDVPDHYNWFKNNYNYNADDCCNLRKGIDKKRLD